MELAQIMVPTEKGHVGRIWKSRFFLAGELPVAIQSSAWNCPQRPDYCDSEVQQGAPSSARSTSSCYCCHHHHSKPEPLNTTKNYPCCAPVGIRTSLKVVLSVAIKPSSRPRTARTSLTTCSFRPLSTRRRKILQNSPADFQVA